jgi:hypothetical protein
MITVPVSVGEVLDKISILEIKSERIGDPVKVANVRRELEGLVQAAKGFRVPELEARLKEVNGELWVWKMPCGKQKTSRILVRNLFH